MTFWPAIVAFAIVLSLSWLLCKCFGAPDSIGRFASLDGLRGYLAFGVFIHHGAVWYQFLRTGEWERPTSPLYSNLGQASVALFFMITGFLFWSKLLRGRSEPIDWSKLYLSRILRLTPLYAIAVILVVVTVGILTDFHLTEPLLLFAKNVMKWVTFTFKGPPNLNGVDRTFVIIAGVTWTLPYEWLFYFALPLMGILVGAVATKRLLIGSVLTVSWVAYQIRPEWIHLAAFGGGIAAALLVHFNCIHPCVRGGWSSLVASAALLVAVTCFPNASEPLPLLLLTMAFVIIVGGNTIFGVLAWPASHFLGQLTYSVYLLHGIILFWVFRFGVGFTNAASFSLLTHWATVWACIPIVLCTCYVTFRWIELPGMRSVSKISERTNKWFRG